MVVFKGNDMAFALKVTPIVGENGPIAFNTVEGINDAGTMALCRADYASNEATGPVKVFGRGIRADVGKTSCIFEGLLDGTNLDVRKVIISPEMLLKTEGGKDVVGYEDPSSLQSWDRRSCSKLLCTRAFRNEAGGISGDTIILDPRATHIADSVSEYLGLDSVQKALAVYGYTEVNLAKEVNRLSDSEIVFEIGGKLHGLPRKSRIITCDRLGSYRPFWEPAEGTWYSNHVSTGSNALYMNDGLLRIMVFNGSQMIDYDGELKNTWSFGLMAIDQSGRLRWVSPEPICEPPTGVEPGPGGQLIAFASDAWFRPDGEGWILSVLYHAMDRFPCLAKFRLELVTSN